MEVPISTELLGKSDFDNENLWKKALLTFSAFEHPSLSLLLFFYWFHPHYMHFYQILKNISNYNNKRKKGIGKIFYQFAMTQN